MNEDKEYDQKNVDKVNNVQIDLFINSVQQYLKENIIYSYMVFKEHKDDYQFGEDYDLAIPNE